MLRPSRLAAAIVPYAPKRSTVYSTMTMSSCKILLCHASQHNRKKKKQPPRNSHTPFALAPGLGKPWLC
ncbi:hypothetical protein GUJ93_ZPchr0013g36354 [Zizania palustris]|uniref:Uncharacterized protein n=1 Tax=Zizania palustris TaxID=103762 RepID=A0A8J6C6C2_ZIZPA|nr:hypothetical protein GUJ93_ZPchr0013g36354 [Zizania palustris]